MKKKWLTFSAGLAGVISCAFLIVMNIITVIYLEDLASVVGHGRGNIQAWEAAVCILGIISIVPIALNSCAINVLTIEKYKKCKSKIVTAIVFNFIVLLYNLMIVIGLYAEAWMIAISIIIIVALLACNVLYIVDLALKVKESDDAPVKTNKVSQNVNKADSEEEQLLNELEKLVNLRERKILTQEEFEKLKSQVVTKHIEK